MPSSHNVLTLSIAQLSEQMTLDEIRPLAVPNGLSQSEACETVSPERSNVITQKSYKRACAQGPGFSLGLTLEVLSSWLMCWSGTLTSH